MGWLVGAIAVATSAFIATNLDDIVVLVIFFSQVSARFRPRHILLGQYLGFSVLVLASLPGYLGRQVIPETWLSWLGLIPIGIGLRLLLQQDPDDGDADLLHLVSEPRATTKEVRWKRVLRRLIAPESLQVAAVTIANGGDNISIYVPLFASTNGAELVITLAVFYLLTAVENGVAYWVASHPAIASLIHRYGQRLVPFVLIGLGLFILTESWLSR